VAVPDDEVGVLAGLQRAHAVLDAQLDGRVQGDEVQRRLLVEPAVADGLGGLQVHAPGQVAVVGVERHHDAVVVHDGAVVGDGVVGLQLVGPPVGERGAARAMGRHLVSHLVALEDMLEGADPEAEVLGQADQHEDLVLAVGVGVDPALSLEDLHQGLQLQVTAGWYPARLLLLGERVPLVPFLLVILGRPERSPDDLLDPHAGVRIAILATLDVLAEGELDGGRDAVDEHVLGPVGLVAQLDDGGLATDGVGRAVQHLGRGEAAGELPVPGLVGGVEDVLDAHFRGHRVRPFVDGVGARVAVGVDEPGGDVTALAVDDQGAGGSVEAGTDLHDLAVLDQQVCVVEDALRGWRSEPRRSPR